MAKRNSVVDRAPAVSDLADDASAYLKRLIDETPLREAVSKLIDEGQSAVDELPAKGRKASKQAKEQLKAAQQEASKQAKRQRRKLKKQAKAQQRKLERKGAAVAAEAKVVAKQNKPGIGRVIGLAGVGSIAALALSEGLRSKVLDLLFGAEEEFQYTPPEPPANTAASTGSPLSAA